jgi:hypothetical protein
MLPASADGLKNSLNGFMGTKNKKSTVNLGRINLNAKARSTSKPKKKRSGDTVISTVGDYKILKKEADEYLERATGGKIKNYDRLPQKQRDMVIKDLVRLNSLKDVKSREPDVVIATINGVNIVKKDADAYLAKVTSGNSRDFDKLDVQQKQILLQDLARPIMIELAINEDIVEEEKNAFIKQIWIEKRRAEVTVSNAEMLAFYEDTKKKALAQNAQAVIPSYMSLGARIKNQVIEKKIIDELMVDVKVEVYE